MNLRALLRNCLGSRSLEPHGDINKGKSGAAEGFVFAENEREVALDQRVRHRDGGQNAGFYVFKNIGARDEADTNVGSDEALEQLAGVKLHGDDGLQVALVKERFDSIARAAEFGKQQREL